MFLKLLSNSQAKEEFIWNFKKSPEVNENETGAYQILWDTEKTMLWAKFITLNTCIRKVENLKIDELGFHFKKLEKEQQR